MRYTEDTAKRLAEKHKLSPFTIRKWRTQQSIPDRYFKPSDVADISEARDIVGALNLQCINIIQVAATTGTNSDDPEAIEGIPYQHLKDVCRGKAKLTATQVKELREIFDAIKQVLITIVEAAESGNRVEFWKAWELLPIKWATLLDNRTEYYLFINRKKDKALPSKTIYFRRQAEKLIVSLEKLGI